MTDVKCHCCKLPRLYFDDFGYICDKCKNPHCNGCLQNVGNSCIDCTNKKIQSDCLFCKEKPIKLNKRGKTTIHKHHIKWKRFGFPHNGETINICAKHHQNLHSWIENEAIKICLKYDDKFFENMTAEYTKLYGIK